jgi:hypothetical protein
MRRGLKREDFLQLAGVMWPPCNVIDVFDLEKLWTPRIIDAAYPDLFTPGTRHIPLMMTARKKRLWPHFRSGSPSIADAHPKTNMA